MLSLLKKHIDDKHLGEKITYENVFLKTPRIYHFCILLYRPIGSYV